MYNKYMGADEDVFDELYVEVENAPKNAKKPDERPSHTERFDLRRFFNGLNINDMGIVPIVLLLLLLLDVDDEERLIIIALAFIFGI